MIRSAFFAVIGLLSICPWLTASEVVFESPPYQTTLIELFTSEGCSSCPPADKWVSSLKNSESLWKDIIPISFHVTYWNYLGWKDRFSEDDYDTHQRQYASLTGQRTVYTPAMYLNGQEWRGWFETRGIPFFRGEEVGVVRLEVSEDNGIKVEFDSVSKEKNSWIAHVVLLGFGLKSEIGKGENRGLNAEHDFVVLDYVRIPLTIHGEIYSAGVKPLKSVLTSEAKRTGAAVWVTSGSGHAPVQAAGGFLPVKS